MASELLLFLAKANLALVAAVLLVLALRRPVRTAFGARNAYALWLIVPLAMLASLVPARTIHLPTPTPVASIADDDTARAAGAANVSADTVAKRQTLRLPLPEILLGIWIAVALGRLLVQAERQRRFVHELGRLSIWNGILWSDRPAIGPAVVGALFPRIVVPSDFAARFTREEQALILAHEQNHLVTGDARINAVVTGLLCLLWFNPVAYIGAAVLRIDQEIACDAAVLARHPNTRRTYAEAMLKTQLAPSIPPLGCHWPASANKQLKERFTLLAVHRNSRRRNLGGGVTVAVLALATSVSAWAAQPAQIVREVVGHDTTNPSDNRLFGAVRSGDIGAVRDLIARGANVNASISGDGSPLIEASRNGRLEIVRLLLAAGADPNLAVHGDGTPLIQAAGSGSLETVRLLVERGADVEKFVPDDETPLIRAAQSGDLDIVRYLVEHGADVKRAVPADPGQMRSPLGEARRNGHGDLAAYLISKGA